MMLNMLVFHVTFFIKQWFFIVEERIVPKLFFAGIHFSVLIGRYAAAQAESIDEAG